MAMVDTAVMVAMGTADTAIDLTTVAFILRLSLVIIRSHTMRHRNLIMPRRNNIIRNRKQTITAMVSKRQCTDNIGDL